MVLGGSKWRNKKLAILYTVKSPWHLCDWSYSDRGLVVKNLVRCWDGVSCVPRVGITARAIGKLADGLCAFASATTVLIQEYYVRSMSQTYNQDTGLFILPTQLHGRCFSAEANQVIKYSCKTCKCVSQHHQNWVGRSCLLCLEFTSVNFFMFRKRSCLDLRRPLYT